MFSPMRRSTTFSGVGSSTSTPRITIIHPGALGDCILSLPAIQELKRTFPRGYITVIGYPRYWNWLQGWFIDALYNPDSLPLHRLFDSQLSTIDFLSTFFSRQDFVLSWFGDETFHTNLAQLVPGKVIVHPFRHQGLHEHASRFFLQSLKGVGLSPPTKTLPDLVLKLPFYFSSGSTEKLNRPCIVIHPGSGSRKKCWPVVNFARLVHQIYQQWGIAPILLFGEADGEIKKELLNLLKPREREVVENKDLSEVASILQHCDCYIGNDSGISHLAGVLGVPSLVLFGPTDPNIWQPLGPKVQVFYDPHFRQSVAAVWKHLQAILQPSGG